MFQTWDFEWFWWWITIWYDVIIHIIIRLTFPRKLRWYFENVFGLKIILMFKIQKIASRFHERFPGCTDNYPLHPNRKAPELGLSFGRWKHYAVYQDMPFGTQISHWDSLGTSPTTGWYLYPFKSQFILISSQGKLLERDPFNFIYTWSIIRTWDSMDR